MCKNLKYATLKLQKILDIHYILIFLILSILDYISKWEKHNGIMILKKTF